MESIEMREKNQGKNPLKKWVILLGILTVIFLCTTIYFGFVGEPVLNTQYTQAVTANEDLQGELDSILVDHEKIKGEYGELAEQLTEKDSVIMANAEEIKHLIASQADYRKIKRQLARLQNIAKEYMDQLDQLYTENKMLKEENLQVKANLQQSKLEKEQVEQTNKDLSNKINSAAVHKAYNVNCRGIYYKNNGMEVVTEKANRVEVFKTTFILSENSLIPAGPVNVYCRIAIPGTGRIIVPGAGDAYSFLYNGERLQYTSKQTVNYSGSAETCSLIWDIKEGDKAIKGRYNIQVYADDVFLGETVLDLK